MGELEDTTKEIHKHFMNLIIVIIIQLIKVVCGLSLTYSSIYAPFLLAALKEITRKMVHLIVLKLFSLLWTQSYCHLEQLVIIVNQIQ